MADQSFSHTAEVMRAALPYFDSRSKVRAEIFTKLFDVMGSLRTITSPLNMAACGFESTKFDLEGMLNGIRPICSNREREFIDRILNFFNMRRMFETYNNMMSAMKAMQGFEGFPFGDSQTGDDTDTVTGNFSGMNFESIFGNSESKSKESEADADRQSDAAFASDTDHFDHQDQEYDSEKASDGDQTPHFGNTSGPMNNKMFDMLKAMVPPEQMSTFENLSMLLNSMSYDNNSKPHDSKEQNDG